MRIVAFAIAALAVSLAACQDASNEAAEKMIEASASNGGQNVDVEIGDNDSVSMSADTEQGKMQMQAGEGTKLPEDFPKDIPVYKGFTPSFIQTLEDQETFSVQGTVEASLDEVAKFYIGEAIAEGWQEILRVFEHETKTLQYEKDDRALSVLIMSQDGKATVTLTAARK